MSPRQVLASHSSADLTDWLAYEKLEHGEVAPDDPAPADLSAQVLDVFKPMMKAP